MFALYMRRASKNNGRDLMKEMKHSKNMERLIGICSLTRPPAIVFYISTPLSSKIILFFLSFLLSYQHLRDLRFRVYLFKIRIFQRNLVLELLLWKMLTKATRVILKTELLLGTWEMTNLFDFLGEATTTKFFRSKINFTLNKKLQILTFCWVHREVTRTSSYTLPVTTVLSKGQKNFFLEYCCKVSVDGLKNLMKWFIRWLQDWIK